MARRWTDEETELLIELVGSGMNYKEIADTGLIDRTYTACFRRGNKLKLSIEETDWEERFAHRFELLHKGFEYVSDYKDASGYFKCRCRECGHVDERSASSGRRRTILQCANCLELEREECKTLYQRELATRRLRRTLLKVIRAEAAEQERAEYLSSLENHTCSECGDTFTATSKGNKYCGRRCASRVHDRTKRAKKRLRAEANGAVDTITLDELIIKDGNECYLCGEECNRNDYVISDEGHFIVGRTYPSIDHVMPVAKGGTHTWDNVRLTHHHCNTIKSDNLIGEVLQMA